MNKILNKVESDEPDSQDKKQNKQSHNFNWVVDEILALAPPYDKRENEDATD